METKENEMEVGRDSEGEGEEKKECRVGYGRLKMMVG